MRPGQSKLSCCSSIPKFSFGGFPARCRVHNVVSVKVLDFNYNTNNTLLSILYLVVIMESEVFIEFL